jgi:hypothetical protein
MDAEAKTKIATRFARKRLYTLAIFRRKKALNYSGLAGLLLLNVSEYVIAMPDNGLVQGARSYRTLRDGSYCWTFQTMNCLATIIQSL